jgi:hypothetical protein
MNDKLNAGAQFPQLTLTVAGESLIVPELKESGYSIILFYRGHW